MWGIFVRAGLTPPNVSFADCTNRLQKLRQKHIFLIFHEDSTTINSAYNGQWSSTWMVLYLFVGFISFVHHLLGLDWNLIWSDSNGFWLIGIWYMIFYDNNDNWTSNTSDLVVFILAFKQSLKTTVKPITFKLVVL